MSPHNLTRVAKAMHRKDTLQHSEQCKPGKKIDRMTFPNNFFAINLVV